MMPMRLVKMKARVSLRVRESFINEKWEMTNGK